MLYSFPDAFRVRSYCILKGSDLVLKARTRFFCLLLCLCLFCAAAQPALADQSPAAAEFPGDAGSLFDGILESPDDFQLVDALHLDAGLRQKLREYDLGTLGEDLKDVLKNSAQLSDEELAESISGLAEDHGISLVDSQVQQLCDLCRGLEKLSGDELEEKLEDLKQDLESLNQRRQKLSGFFGGLRNFLHKLADLTRRLAAWIGRIFDSKPE